MASRQSMARKLSLLVICLSITAAGCDDDNAADSGHGHDDEEHGDHSHGEAGESGGHAHDKPVGPVTGAECPDQDTTLTYDNFGKKFMQDYCLRCHSESVTGADRKDAPADHNFDTLAEIDLLADHIDQKAGSGPTMTNEAMPPGDPKPTLEERKKLSEWLACGVPN